MNLNAFGSSSNPNTCEGWDKVKVNAWSNGLKSMAGVGDSESGGEDQVDHKFGTRPFSNVRSNETVWTPSVIEVTCVKSARPEKSIFVVPAK